MQVYFEKEQAYLKSNSVHLELQSYTDIGVTARPHIHAALELIIFQEGSFDAVLGNKTYSAQPGDLLLARSNTIHHYICKTPGRASYWVLKIKPALITEIAATDQCGEYLMFFAVERDSSRSFWTKQSLTGTPLQAAIDRLLAEYTGKAYAFDIGIRLSAAQLLLAIIRQAHENEAMEQSALDESVTRRIYDAVVFINKNYNQNITAEDCSKIACMSYSYFSRSFRAVTGKNFKEYLNQVRVAHAEKALLTTDMSVTEVAAHCGYDNVSYFISVYKRIKGVTPHATAKQKKFFGSTAETT